MKPIVAETGYQFAKQKGFNAINIYLDGRPSCDLSWDSAESEIETALNLGARLSFEIDLGIVGNLRDPTGYFSRGIAISTFEERIYKKYKEEIISIILYRGNGYIKDEESRVASVDLLMQYLHRVGASLIDDIPLVALFDFRDVEKPSHQAELLSRSFFPYILPGVKGALIDFHGFGWEGEGSLGYIGSKLPTVSVRQSASLGIVVPESMSYDLFDQTIDLLHQRKIPYSTFPEHLMIDHWHGLDYILVFSETITAEGRRMLQGFNAAAGQVVAVGDSLGLSEEISFEEFIRSRGI